MNDNSGLTPAQNAGTTGNPQSANGNVDASDSGAFQQSAGVDALAQNRPISVVQTGKPNRSAAARAGSVALMWLFIVVASVVLIMVASSVFKWIMKKPEPVKAPKEEKSVAKPAAKTSAVSAVQPKGKKKLPRSKRNKK